MILWYAWRALTTSKGFFNLSTLLSVISLSLGVATLVTVMSLVNGYESSLKSSVYDVFGHLLVSQPPLPIYDPKQEILNLKKELKPLEFKASPYLQKEALVVKRGEIQGVLVEGLEASSFRSVSSIQKRIIKGKFDLQKAYEIQGAYIGKGIAENFGYKIGDKMNIVVPLSDMENGLRRGLKSFEILGILDLGKYEYNNRYILTEIRLARQLFEFSEGSATGLRLKFQDPMEALKVQNIIIVKALRYFAQSWKDTNSSLFEAIKIEKLILFLVLCIMILVGAFNLSTSLFLSVYKKTVDISVLRAIGLKSLDISKIFVTQGLIIGSVGYIVGVLLGFVFIALLNWVVRSGLFLPPEVYKLNSLVLRADGLDMFFIFIASMLICFFATLSPAMKSVKIQPAEGLRYD